MKWLAAKEDAAANAEARDSPMNNNIRAFAKVAVAKPSFAKVVVAKPSFAKVAVAKPSFAKVAVAKPPFAI